MPLRSSKPTEPTLQAIAGKLDVIQDDLNNLKADMKDVHETVDFLKEHAVTREEFDEKLGNGLQSLRTELRTEIRETRDEMIGHVDHFIQLHKKQEVELAALAPY